MTPADLQRIRDYCAKATAGPWETMYNIGCDGTYLSGLQEECYVGCEKNEFPADMQFIANARTDLPACLDEVEKMRAELAETRDNWNRVASENNRRGDDLASLRAENERLRALVPSPAVNGAVNDIIAIQGQSIATLTADLAEARRDGQRLDWLEDNHIEFSEELHRLGWRAANDAQWEKLKLLLRRIRHAIDAAMSASTGEGK